MMKDGDTVTLEVGDELLVVTAKHASGHVSVVGVFTDQYLADVGANAFAAEYGKTNDGSYGPVLETECHAACLDQHGLCPVIASTDQRDEPGPRAAGTREIGTFVDAEPPTEPQASPSPVARQPQFEEYATLEKVLGCPQLLPGPYTKEAIMAAPENSVLHGEVSEPEKVVVWDVFWPTGAVIGDYEGVGKALGLPVAPAEPEMYHEAGCDGEPVPEGFDPKECDDIDAAICFLRAGGTLCKVHDEPGSRYYRFLVIPVEGAVESGNG